MSLDKTFCCSLNCKNKCGRKLTDAQKLAAIALNKLLSFANFCGNKCEEA